ncbi:hypothetical protein C7M84_003433, partial [Penaeus vannamei]
MHLHTSDLACRIIEAFKFHHSSTPSLNSICSSTLSLNKLLWSSSFKFHHLILDTDDVFFMIGTQDYSNSIPSSSICSTVEKLKASPQLSGLIPLHRLDPKLPEFVLQQQRKRRTGSSCHSQATSSPRLRWRRRADAERRDLAGGGRRGGHKGKAEWSAPAWARSENYDDAPLSVDQVDVIRCDSSQIVLTIADRSSGDSAVENVQPADKWISSVPMLQLATNTETVGVMEHPAETKTLGVGSDEEGRGNSCFSGEKSKTRCQRHRSRRKLFYEEHITKDDDFICCSRRSEKDRARLTAPWPLTVYDSKVKGAARGVWTNAHLPAHLVFGPYEGRVLSGHPEAGKESGYGWKIRSAGTRNTCIDAVDSAVSNWMRYVNCSRTDAETNLSAFQYKGQIYYKTDSAISRGSELMCWYGDDFGKDLGLSREPSKWKSAKKDAI